MASLYSVQKLQTQIIYAHDAHGTRIMHDQGGHDMSKLSGFTMREVRDTIDRSIPVNQFRPYHKHPRRNLVGSKQFEALCADVKENGVREQIRARYTLGEKNDEGNELYEIISGHCRWEAAKEAGLKKINAKIETIQDDEADKLVTSSNFGCKNLLPSEIGKFCKLWMDAKNKQGERRLNNDEPSNRIILKEMYGLSSGTDVHRHIRYAHLIPEFQDYVDYEKGWLGIGENISYLNESEQNILFQILTNGEYILTTSQSKDLKDAKRDENGNSNQLSEGQIKLILDKGKDDPIAVKKRRPKSIKVPYKPIEQFVTRHFENTEASEEDVQALIIKALEAYKPEN